ncbi:MAG: hypothetical protein CMK06_13600 [Ponticaulis sp.]|nr:hypothetical protein [Ponticaulis sp.]
MSEDTIARLSAEEETALLKLAYSTHHSWLKHYDTLSVALVTLTSTIIFGFFGSNIERYKFANLEAVTFTNQEILEAIALLAMLSIAASIVYAMWREVKEVWSRLVKMEIALGFYKPLNSLSGGQLFKDKMQETATSIPTLFKLAFAIFIFLTVLVLLHPVISDTTNALA